MSSPGLFKQCIAIMTGTSTPAPCSPRLYLPADSCFGSEATVSPGSCRNRFCSITGDRAVLFGLGTCSTNTPRRSAAAPLQAAGRAVSAIQVSQVRRHAEPARLVESLI